jgi:DHA1 family multidrug resistance protein-like MFS transporter
MTPEARVCTAAFLVYLGIGMTGPVLAEGRRDLGLSAAELGAVVAAFGLARLCVDLPAGAVAARFGFRSPFVLGAFLLAAGFLWSAAAGGTPALMGGQVLAGLGGVFCHVTALVVLARWAAPGRSGRTMGRYFGATFLGLAAGGAMAGQVAAALGWRAAFGAAAGVSVLGLGTALLAPAEPRERYRLEPAMTASLARWRPLLAPRLVAIYLLHFTALFLWAGVRTAVWPSLASDAGLSVRAIGLALGAGSLVTLVTLAGAGRLGDRWGKVPVVSIGLLVCVGGLGVSAMIAGALALLVTLLLMDVGQALLAPSASALLADEHPHSSIGRATGLMRLLGDTGWIIGPLVVTGIMEWRAASLALGVAALVPLGNLILLRAVGSAGRTTGRPDLTAAASPVRAGTQPHRPA